MKTLDWNIWKIFKSPIFPALFRICVLRQCPTSMTSYCPTEAIAECTHTQPIDALASPALRYAFIGSVVVNESTVAWKTSIHIHDSKHTLLKKDYTIPYPRSMYDV